MAILNDVRRDGEDGQGSGSGSQDDQVPSIIEQNIVEEQAVVSESEDK